jgi:transcriptional regulator with XRE-family HTH domain
MVIVEKIRRLAKRKGWSQGEFAALAGMRSNRISKWANDEGEPTLKQGLAMARLLGVPLEYLADDEAPDPGTPEALRELEVWRIVKAIGPEAAWLRLVGAGGKAAVEDGSTAQRRDPSDGSRSPEAKEPRRRGSA